MSVELRCERFIRTGEKLEKKLYLFALMQLGNRTAASEVLTEAFVSCYRGGCGQGGAQALEMDAFRAIFELGGSAHYAMGDSAGDVLPDPKWHARLAGLPPLERAAVVLTFFCRFEARDAADILGISADRVRDLNLRWIESLCPSGAGNRSSSRPV